MNDFSAEERAAVYRAIAERRDVRSDFLRTPINEAVLLRILAAGHRAPSVGFCQPWRFILVRDQTSHAAVYDAFAKANDHAAAAYSDEDSVVYRQLRLQGLKTAPLGLCVISAREPTQGRGLGRQTMPEMAKYSTVCAIQNMWLAARAEGIGMGWVSILDPAELRKLFAVPQEFEIVAYFCVGYTSRFAEKPDLEVADWQKRLPLESVISYERYQAI